MMNTYEGEWGIFTGGWERYKRMTALTDSIKVKEDLRECCGKQLNKRVIQLHSQDALGKCNEGNLLEFIKAVTLRGVHKEVHRTSFQTLQQQSGELKSLYVARLKATADLCQFTMAVPKCEVYAYPWAHHKDKRQLNYRDEMVGTHLVAGACNKEYREKVLAESANLKSLVEKLEWL